MKSALILTTVFTLFIGCATTPHGVFSIAPEVRKMSMTDDTLFRDLLTKSGGVMHADMVLYPRSERKTVTRIEVLTPYNSVQTGMERWFIEHEGRDTTAYLVRLIPDGHGGTAFTVQRDTNHTKSGAP